MSIEANQNRAFYFPINGSANVTDGQIRDVIHDDVITRIGLRMCDDFKVPGDVISL
jgi:hypothetical protein